MTRMTEIEEKDACIRNLLRARGVSIPRQSRGHYARWPLKGA